MGVRVPIGGDGRWVTWHAIIVDGTVTCRMRRADVIDNAHTGERRDRGALSSGQATYEGVQRQEWAGSPRHDLFSHYMAEKYRKVTTHPS